MDRLLFFLIDDLSRGWVVRLLLVLLVYSGILLGEIFDWSPLRTSFSIATVSATILLTLTSPYIRGWILNRHITGFWIYSASSEYGGDGYVKRTVAIPTLVRIYQAGSSLKMTGYHEGSDGEDYFVAGEAALSNPSSVNGRYTYWYRSSASAVGEKVFSGVASLEWQRESTFEPVTRMRGSFCGISKKHIGTLDYRRISKNEFHQRLRRT